MKSGSMCNVQIALQKLYVAAIMLHRMVFCFYLERLLSYIRIIILPTLIYAIQLVQLTFFLSRLASHTLNLAENQVITLTLAYIPTHPNVEADFLLVERLVPEWHLLPHMA